MRVIPGRLAIWVHAIFQILATCIFIAAAGLGIYLVKNVTLPRGGSLVSYPSIVIVSEVGGHNKNKSR